MNVDDEKEARHATDGRTRLADYLTAEPGRSQQKLATALGIEQPSVSAWINGRSRPEPEHREALEILLGIPRSSWMTARELAVVERARQTAKAA